MILNACFSQTFHWFNEAEIDCLESLPNLPRIQKIVQVWFVVSTFFITTSSMYKNRFITSGPRACQSKNDEDECVRLYYHIQYNLYMLLLIVPYQCKCHEPMPRTGATGECGRFVSVTPERSRRRHEFFGSVGGGLWIHVHPWCFQVASCPGWKSLKKSYLQQDLQTNLCEELDKRVPVVSGASSSRTASEWIEVARKRSWTPSGRISGAAHISIWSYYLECILLHCLPTSEMDNSSIWESLLKTSIVMIWRHRKLQKSKKWWKSMKPSCVEKKPWQRQRCHCGSLVEWTHDIEMISIYYISSKRYKKRIPKRDRYTQKSHAQKSWTKTPMIQPAFP